MHPPLCTQRDAILGMNYRNRHLIARRNPKELIAVANDKSTAKRCLAAAGIPVPNTLHEIRSHRGLEPAYSALVKSEQGFVVKPALSSRGRGVTICSRALPDRVLDHHDRAIPRKKFCFLLAQILDGEFSFSRTLDTVLIEQRLRPDPSWILPDSAGAPDLRVIVFQGCPVMAMARVPTAESEGRANLHRGGIGLGIDLTSGQTTDGVWKNRPITHHPDTHQLLRGHRVRGVGECLRVAAKCYDAVPLGYMGVDILFDVQLGPMVIEINARPGLNVQIANRQGLLTRCHSSEPSLRNYEPPTLAQEPLRAPGGAVGVDWVSPPERFPDAAG